MKRFRAYLREDRLDELSKTTLGSYIKKSSAQVAHHASAGAKIPDKDKEAKRYHSGKVVKRLAGIKRATNKLKKATKAPRVKPLKKPAKKSSYGHMGVHSLIAKGIYTGVSKGIIGVARRIVR